MHVKAKASEPITDPQGVQNILQALNDSGSTGGHYAVIWGIGCLMGLRVSDVLTIRAGDILGQTYYLKPEKKTGKVRRIKISPGVNMLLDALTHGRGQQGAAAPLISSRKDMQTLENKAVHRVFKQTIRNVGFTGNHGTHTMRKTFAYHVWEMTHNIDILQELFQHSDRFITRKYLPEGLDVSVTDRTIWLTDDEVYDRLSQRFALAIMGRLNLPRHYVSDVVNFDVA